MKTLRGAVLGCGMISDYHITAWKRMPEVEIVALADLNEHTALLKRDQYLPDAIVGQDIERLLDHVELDFIDILTPPRFHKEHCLMAAEKNLHIICQKPISDDWSDARDLAHFFQSYEKHCCIHENHPFRPWFAEVASLLEQGRFGRIEKVAVVHKDASEPAEGFKINSKFGILLDYGVHVIAMVRSLLGEPNDYQVRFGHPNPRVHGESESKIALDFTDCRATVELAWQDQKTYQGGFLIETNQGSIHYAGSMTRGDKARLTIMNNNARSQRTINPTEEFVESFYLFQRAFVKAVLEGEKPPQPISDNIKTLDLVFSLYQHASP